MRSAGKFLFVVLLFASAVCGAASPVTPGHLQELEELLARNGLGSALVVLDARGRVRLSGTYRDEAQVSLAFSLAQSVVGVSWVSPVTPENIQVQAWEKKFGQALERFFSKPGPTAPSVDENPPGPIARRYALVVGIGSFRDGGITPLQFAAKDAHDVWSYLVSPSGGGFDKSDVILLTDEQATKANIEGGLDRIRSRAQADDLVFVYIGSHGTPPHIYGNVQIVTHDTQVRPRHAVWSTSLSDDRVGEFVRSVRAKRLIMVVDVCYSNGAYKKVAGFLPSGGKSLIADDEEASGMSRDQMAKRILGAKDLVLDDDAPTPGSRKPTSQAWGKVLVSASDSGEKSWESDRLRNSFFTYYFLEGMKKSADVKTAFEYARPRTTEAVRVEKDHIQRPQVVTDRKEWAIRVSGR